MTFYEYFKFKYQTFDVWFEYICDLQSPVAQSINLQGNVTYQTENSAYEPLMYVSNIFPAFETTLF